MITIRVLLTTLVLAGLAVGATYAADPAVEIRPENLGQTDLRTLLETIRSNRRALIGVNLGLTPDEAAKFWPLYDRYMQEVTPSGDRIAALVQDYIANYRTMSNDKALQMVGEYLAADADRIKVRQTFVPEFAKVLPGRTVARFYQIENKMDAVLRYDLASTIPVVEEAAAAPAK